MRLAVQLPEGEDLNEWLAVHGVSDSRFVDRKTLTFYAFERSRRLFQSPEYVVRYSDGVLYTAGGTFEIFYRSYYCNSAPWVSVRSCLQALGEK